MKLGIYNIILIIGLIIVIGFYLFDNNLKRGSGKLLVLAIIILSIILNNQLYYNYRKEDMTAQSNEAIQDIASIYNASGTLTVPNLRVTGDVSVDGTTTLKNINAKGNINTYGNINASGTITASNISATQDITVDRSIINKNYTLGTDSQNNFNITNNLSPYFIFSFQTNGNICAKVPVKTPIPIAQCTSWFT